jgi:hypothetical protein
MSAAKLLAGHAQSFESNSKIITSAAPFRGRIRVMAKVELRNPAGSGRLGVKWWDWLVFAAVLEVYLPRKKGQRMQLWDWVILAAVVSSAFL